MKRHLIDWVRNPPGGRWFVIAAALIVALAGYLVPEVFPSAEGTESDRFTIWLQILLFGGSAALMLIQTRRWTGLNRAIVWVFLGLVCLYLLLVSRHEGWTFTRTANWLWMTRFVIIFGAITYIVSLSVEKIRDARQRRRDDDGVIV